MKNSRKLNDDVSAKGTLRSKQSLKQIFFSWPFIVAAFLKVQEILYWVVTLLHKTYKAKKTLKDSYTQCQDWKSKLFGVADQLVLLEMFQSMNIFHFFKW